MIMLLLIWVGASTLFCLALLAAAARRTPLLDEQLEAERRLELSLNAAAALDNARARPLQTWSDVPLPPLPARTAKSLPAPAGDPPRSLPLTPVCSPADSAFSYVFPML